MPNFLKVSAAKNCQKIGMYPENMDTYDSELSQHNVH